MLTPGFYEQIVNHFIRQGLDQVDEQTQFINKHSIDEAESAGTLAKYIESVVKNTLTGVRGQDALTRRIEICNRLIQDLGQETGDPDIQQMTIHPSAEFLLALLDKQNSILGATRSAAKFLVRPTTSLAQSSLFTGAPSEPSMIAELKREILTSDRMDMLVSFIKWSGLRMMMDELREFTKSKTLRIITTSYMGATDIKAIDELRQLPNTNIRVSYDTTRTRLHAKAYIFHRETGFSTAYVGSSNVSNAALSTGLEWNVKVAAKDLPETFGKLSATFEGYWNDYEFTKYEHKQRPILVEALRAERYQSANHLNFLFDIAPYGFQKEILEKLDAERRIHGHYRNLIVAATGTGKTVISAFDFKRFFEANRTRPSRLLFVAHREEILKQSLDCFRTVLRNQNFGELFVGGHEPTQLDYLFVSIQTLNSRNLPATTSPEHFDFIVVDEFHHAAAASYQLLLTYYQPQVLLGLTATPERLDSKDVAEYFDHRIAAEIRLPEAIDRNLLVPFQYFGVTDSVDLRSLRWRKGSYDSKELDNLYTGNRQRAELVIRSLRRYVTNLNEIRGLGFCTSIAHAEYMAEFMNQSGIPSIALHAKSSTEIRSSAKQQLRTGDIRFIFVVDLYNEGVDIPEVDTILFLRPTESLTVFLQQLGRGLRISTEKECLTVLDFIGQSHVKYRFEEKFGALVTNVRKSIQHEVQDGFLNVPRGCFIQLEKQAKEYVLNNIRQAISTRTTMVNRMQTFVEDTGLKLTLAHFAEYYHLSMREFYRGSTPTSFARLCMQAGVQDIMTDPDETPLTKALPRIASINSRRWIHFLLRVLDGAFSAQPAAELSEVEYQMMLMFHYTVWQKSVQKCGFSSAFDSLQVLTRNPALCAEICDVLRFNLHHIDFVDQPVQLGFTNPLDLHCAYTRDQVLSALGFYTEEAMPAMREGVKYLPEHKLDVLFITLNKSEKDYSPSTMYQDYAINNVLFHWQSQSTTPFDSPTGQRYIHHKETGNRIVLFVREFKEDAAGTQPYTYLGTAEYVNHSGSRPMNVTWRLHQPIPAKIMKHTNHLIVI